MAWRTQPDTSPEAIGPAVRIGPSPSPYPAVEVAVKPRRTVRNRTYRYRKQIRPWLLLPALPALAFLAHILPFWMWAKLLVEVLIGGMFVARQHMKWKRWDECTYAVTCAATGTLWVLYVTRVGLWDGLGRFSALLFLAGWVPLAWLWWERHRVRSRHDADITDTDVDPFLLRWAKNVEPELGWTLSDPLLLDVGQSFLLQLVPGQAIEDAEQAKRKIASLLRMDRAQFTFEPYTSEPGVAAGDESLITMTVTPKRNPHLVEDQTWAGPTLEPATGLYRHGVYPDGEAFGRLFRTEDGVPHRACNSLFTGTTGSGKSRGNAIKIAEHLMSEMFVVWCADGKEGASAPELDGRVDWYATSMNETIRMLRAAWKVMKVRAKMIRAFHQAAFRGEKVIHLGSRAFPLLQIVLDEAQVFLRHPVVARLVKLLLQMGNECGIGVDLLTQVPLLTELGGSSGQGGAEVIRAMAKSGNIAVYRAEDTFTGRVTLASDTHVDPKSLPRIPGSCYLAGHTIRTAVCRGYYVSKAELHEWLQQAPHVPLDEASTRAAGEDYAARHQRAAETNVAPEAVDLGDLDTELAILLGERPPTQPTTTAAADTTVKKMVFEAVKANAGPMKRADIITALLADGHKASDSAVNQALAWWCKYGHMERTADHGHYDLINREPATPAPAGT